MRSSTPPVVLTMGEPAGIAAEITLKAWLALRNSRSTFFVLHDLDYLSDAARALSLSIPVIPISHPDEAAEAFGEGLPVMSIALNAPVAVGRPDSRNAASVVDSIRLATEMAASGEAGALVTNPIQKSALYEIGFDFPGHTEFLEHLAGPGHRATMMLASEQLKVIPVSIHEPLSAAVSGISTAKIVEVARAADAGLRRDFAMERPRLAIAGLNPHAGEAGSMGREEIEVIMPAIETLRRDDIDARGPYPPDTMFTARVRAGYDAAICMYHDQALIPLKTLDVDGGVNVTLGLPFVRTSPDHGTALDIAGKGIADPGSLIAAIRMAIRIAGHREKEKGFSR
ncbi:MAG: 4-hydroxythreonine-4-phosphate dehydrogenase PdxA [Phyllobacterium sp.]